MDTPLADLCLALVRLQNAIRQARQQSKTLDGYTAYIDNFDPALTFRLEDIAFYLNQADEALDRVRDQLSLSDRD